MRKGKEVEQSVDTTDIDGEGVIPAGQAVDDVAGLADVDLLPDLVHQEWVALHNNRTGHNTQPMTDPTDPKATHS